MHDAGPARLGGQPRLRRPATRTRSGPRTWTTPTSCGSTSTRSRACRGAQVARSRWWSGRCSTDHGLAGWPKTSGSRGHAHLRAGSRRGGRSPRCAGPAWRVAREVERARARPGHQPLVEGGAARRLRRLQPERQGPHGRARPTRSGPPPTRGSPPRWPGTRCADCDPADVHPRHGARPVGRARRPVGGHRRRRPGASTALLELADRLRRRREQGRPTRAAEPATPSAAPRTMPLIEIARAATKDEALAGLERWKARHPRSWPGSSRPTCWSTRCAGAAAPGTASGSTCGTCPRTERPAQEPLEVDYDPWGGPSPDG